MTNTRSGSVFMFNGGSGMRSRSPVLGDKKAVLHQLSGPAAKRSSVITMYMDYIICTLIDIPNRFVSLCYLISKRSD